MSPLIMFLAFLQTTFTALQPILDPILKYLGYIGKYFKHSEGVSLSDMAQNSRVRPITVISSDLANVPELTQVLSATLNVFAAYYVQAFTLNEVKVNGLSMDKVLYKLNPNGTYAAESLNTNLYSNINSYQYALPGTNSARSAALEDSVTYDEKAATKQLTNLPNKDIRNDDFFKPDINLSIGKMVYLNLSLPMASQWDKTLTSDIERANNRNKEIYNQGVHNYNSVQRNDYNNRTNQYNNRTDTFNNQAQQYNTNGQRTSISSNGDVRVAPPVGPKGPQNYQAPIQSADYKDPIKNEKGVSGTWNNDIVIPILMQLSSILLDSSYVVELVGSNSVNHSLLERWTEYRAGQIRFIDDLILCNDIIDEKKKLLLKDDSDTYLNILKRIGKAQLSSVLSPNHTTFAAASNIYVISDSVAKEIEYKIGGKLTNANIRHKLFKGNYGMILVIIDKEWETVTMYYRDTDAGTTVTFKSLMKQGNKDMDIYEIFKVFNNGGSPIF